MKKDSEHPSFSSNSLLSAEEISFLLNADRNDAEKNLFSPQNFPWNPQLAECLKTALQTLFTQDIKLTTSFEKKSYKTPTTILFQCDDLNCRANTNDILSFINMCLGYKHCCSDIKKFSADIKNEFFILLKNKIRQGLNNFLSQTRIEKNILFSEEISVKITNDGYSAEFYLSNSSEHFFSSERKDFSEKNTTSETFEVVYPPLCISENQIANWKKGTVLALPFRNEQTAQIICKQSPIAKAVLGRKGNKIAVKIIDKVN